MIPRISGKITNFSRLHWIAITRRDLSTKSRSHVRIIIYRTWDIRWLDGLYQWSRRCVRGRAGTQAMISGIIKWKWNDIALLKPRFQSHRNDTYVFRPKFCCCSGNIRHWTQKCWGLEPIQPWEQEWVFDPHLILAKQVYNLVAREARAHHVNRAWS